MDDKVLMAKVAAAQARYDTMSPEQKAAHDYEQRRSFVRGMCPDSVNIDKWSEMVDKLLPPGIPTRVPLHWVLGKLKKIANTGQSSEPDHWKFRCMARDTAQELIDRLEHSRAFR